jgi:5'-3' exonuclease
MKEIIKKMQDERSQRRADNYVDKVQLGTEGWKLRYYQNKFHVSQQDLSEFL